MLAGHGHPAPFTADFVHHMFEVGEGLVERFLGGVGEMAVGVDADLDLGFRSAVVGHDATIEVGHGAELFGEAADNGEGEGVAVGSGANDRFWGATDGDPEGDFFLMGTRINATIVDSGTVFSFPSDEF